MKTIFQKLLITILAFGAFSFASASEMFIFQTAKADFGGKEGELYIGSPVKVIEELDDKMVLVEVEGVAFGDKLYKTKAKSLLIASKKDGSFTTKDSASDLGVSTVQAKIEKGYLTKISKEVWEEHEEFFYEMCTQCHAAHRPVEHTMIEWEAILQTMKGFAQLYEDEANYILRYLKANANDGFYEEKNSK